MKIEVIDTYSDFLLLEGIWNRLLAESQSEHACLTFEWFKAWWPAFGTRRQLFILLVKNESEQIRAIAPLMLYRDTYFGLPVKKLSFIYNDTSSRMDFIISEGREQILGLILDFIKERKKMWDIAEFKNIAQDSPNFEILLSTLQRQCKLFLKKKSLISFYIPFDTDWKSYLSERSKRFRKNVNYFTNKVRKTKEAKIEKHENSPVSNEILKIICDVSRRSWKARYNREMAHTPAQRVFFELLNQAAGKNGWQDLWLFTLNDKAIAFEYILRYKDKVYPLRSDFDERYRSMAVGTQLNFHIIRH